MISKKRDIKYVPKEFQQARKDFQKKLEQDDSLGLLLLIDPIRAFEDAGIKLSPETRRYIYRNNPQFAYGNKRLYQAVKRGEVKPPWIRSVRFHFDS